VWQNPEVTELKDVIGGLENVLHLRITMKKGRTKIVHGSNAFTDVYKNLKDLCFCETFAQTSVHHVNDSTTFA
jgi:hypothetical protein